MGLGRCSLPRLGVEVEGAARGQRFTGDVKEGWWVDEKLAICCSTDSQARW